MLSDSPFPPTPPPHVSALAFSRPNGSNTRRPRTGLLRVGISTNKRRVNADTERLPMGVAVRARVHRARRAGNEFGSTGGWRDEHVYGVG